MPLQRIALILTLLGGFTAAAISQSLSPEQRKIVDAVNADEQNSLSLLRQLVNINSGTLNPDGVRQVANVLRPQFESLGFGCQWISMEKVNRAGHLVCSRQGTHGKRVLLIGHMDTVFEPGSPFQSFEEKNGKTVGPGVADMKGGLVILLSALKALHRNGALEGTRITVFLTGDEERPGEPLSMARRDLIAAGKTSDAAVEFEGGVQIAGHDAASISRRGAYQWVLSTSGKTAHSSGVFRPEVGYGAIYEMSRILYRFSQELHDSGLTYNVGLIVGGTQASYDPSSASGTAAGKVNVVPATTQAVGDIRTTTEEQYKRTQEKMRQIIREHLPGTLAQIEFKDGYPQCPRPGATDACFQD